MSLNHLKSLQQGLSDNLNIGCSTFECKTLAKFDGGLEANSLQVDGKTNLLDDVKISADLLVTGDITTTRVYQTDPNGYNLHCTTSNQDSYTGLSPDLFEGASILGDNPGTVTVPKKYIKNPGAILTLKCSGVSDGPAVPNNTVQFYLRGIGDTLGNLADPISLLGTNGTPYNWIYTTTIQTINVEDDQKWQFELSSTLEYQPTSGGAYIKNMYSNNTYYLNILTVQDITFQLDAVVANTSHNTIRKQLEVSSKNL
jgi:hypothetical protein